MKLFSPIFVVGVPRSGTTLISAILSSHPNITITPETHYFNKWIREYHYLDLRDDEDFEVFWRNFVTSSHFHNLHLDAAALHRALQKSKSRSFRFVFACLLELYACVQHKSRVGEKTPAHLHHIDTLLEWYPNSRIVVTMRDPRAVVSSLLKVPWGHKEVDIHARRWQLSAGLVSQWQNHGNVYLIKYEDLVTYPEREAKRLCSFLDEEYEQSMLDHTNAAQSLISGESWKHATAQPMTRANIEKWKTQLSVEDVAVIEFFTRSAMTEFGYDPMTKRLSLVQRVKLDSKRALRKIHLHSLVD